MEKQGTITVVCKNVEPGLPKYAVDVVHLIKNHGVEGDYHAGEFIRHRYLAKKDPGKPNHRQVLLTDNSIYQTLAKQDIHIDPGMLGENIVIEGLSVMQLAVGTRLAINNALLEITEIREPCYQLNEMHPGLQDAVMPDKNDEKTWNAGMMAVVLRGGNVKPGDKVQA